MHQALNSDKKLNQWGPLKTNCTSCPSVTAAGEKAQVYKML